MLCDSESGDSLLGGDRHGVGGRPLGMCKAELQGLLTARHLHTTWRPAQEWFWESRQTGLGPGAELASRELHKFFLFLPLGANINLLYDGNPSFPEKHFCNNSTIE